MLPESTFDRTMIHNAGRFIDASAMVWMRELDVPVDQVWRAVSTKQGLDQWWICPVEIDLRPGGILSHWWKDTIIDLAETEFIDFQNETAGGGGTRFELKPNGDGTLFYLIDSWTEKAVPGESQLTPAANAIDVVQPGGPGTPWSGVAAGWHCAVDDLVKSLTGKVFGHTYEDLCHFYASYLGDHFRWLEILATKHKLVAA